MWRSLAGQAGPRHLREPTSRPRPAHPSWPSVWGLRAPDPRKELGVPGLLVTGPELTEQCAGRAWNPPGPVSAFSTCVGPAGGPQLYFGSWPSAVNRFTPYRRMARVHTGEVTCLARWPGLGPWRFSQADERVSGPPLRTQWPGSLYHQPSWLPPVGLAQRPGVWVASSPHGPGPAPPLPCLHPQDLLAPSLCPLGHLSILRNWAEGHGGIRGPLPPPPRNIVWGDLSGPVCEDPGLFLGHPPQPPMSPCSGRS